MKSVVPDVPRAVLCSVLNTALGAQRKVPMLMKKRLRLLLMIGVFNDTDRFKDTKSTAKTLEDLKMPPAIWSVAVQTFATGQQLRKIMNLNTEVHAKTYDLLIREESAAEALEQAAVAVIDPQ